MHSACFDDSFFCQPALTISLTLSQATRFVREYSSPGLFPLLQTTALKSPQSNPCTHSSKSVSSNVRNHENTYTYTKYAIIRNNVYRKSTHTGKRRLDVDSKNWLLIGFNSSIKFVTRNPVGEINQNEKPS
jgi:hypothetical protein